MNIAGSNMGQGLSSHKSELFIAAVFHPSQVKSSDCRGNFRSSGPESSGRRRTKAVDFPALQVLYRERVWCPC